MPFLRREINLGGRPPGPIGLLIDSASVVVCRATLAELLRGSRLGTVQLPPRHQLLDQALRLGRHVAPRIVHLDHGEHVLG